MNPLLVCGILASALYFILFNLTCLYFILFFVGLYFCLSWYLVPSSASKFNSIRRKIQISTWSDATRPTVIGHTQIRISNSLSYLSSLSKSSSESITLTHLVIKAIGQVLSEFPEVTGKIALGHFIKHPTLDMSCLVNMDEEGSDLYHVAINNVPNKSVLTIAQEVKQKVLSLRTGKEKQKYKDSTKPLENLPNCIMTVCIELITYITSVLGFSLPMFNLKSHPFGSCIVTSLGMHKCEISYVPPSSLLRVPLFICVNSIHDAALVEDSQVVVSKVLNLCYTADIRYFEGFNLIMIMNRVKEIMENPSKYLQDQA